MVLGELGAVVVPVTGVAPLQGRRDVRVDSLAGRDGQRLVDRIPDEGVHESVAAGTIGLEKPEYERGLEGFLEVVDVAEQLRERRLPQDRPLERAPEHGRDPQQRRRIGWRIGEPVTHDVEDGGRHLHPRIGSAVGQRTGGGQRSDQLGEEERVATGAAREFGGEVDGNVDAGAGEDEVAHRSGRHPVQLQADRAGACQRAEQLGEGRGRVETDAAAPR